MAHDNQGTPNRLDKDRILTAVRERCLGWTRNQFPSYLERLDEQLFKASEKAGNNADQSRYFQARDEVKRHQTLMDNRFMAHLENAIANYLQGMDTTTNFRVDPLQSGGEAVEILEENLNLVDKTELEDKLAVASMSRRCGADNSEALYALNQRLSVLRGGVKVTDQGNPFAPGVFAEALQASLHSLTLDEMARLLIYKIFESSLLANLKFLYQHLNKDLVAHGVLPNLRHFVKKTPEEIREDLPEELKNQLSDISINRQLQLIKAIQILQNRLAPNPVHEVPAGVTPITVDQLLDSFQQLQLSAGTFLAQHSAQQDFTLLDTQSIRQRLQEQLDRTQGIDEHVIEIVGLMFEYMLNDEHLPDSVKSLLSYLHTPFLKVALLDKEFFKEPSHPARQLLNSLVAAGERWVEPNAKRKNEVFEQIRKVVERVVNEFNNDIRLFSELAFDFNHYLRQHARRIRLAEKRAQQAALGENKIKEVRLRVDNYLKTKIGAIPITPTLNTLLFEPWASYLVFNLLRFGSDSEQWCQAAQIVDDLLWLCQPHDVDADFHAKKRIEELQQSLPTALQTGFETVGYDQTQAQRLIDAIKGRSDDVVAAPREGAIASVASADIDTVKVAPETSTDSELNELIDKLRNLNFNTWFEFKGDDGEPVQAKLAWSNRKTLHFMFVNRMGQQTAMKSGEQLAEEMRRGKARILSAMEDKPFFEKAMERVLKQLESRQPAPQR